MLGALEYQEATLLTFLGQPLDHHRILRPPASFGQAVQLFFWSGAGVLGRLVFLEAGLTGYCLLKTI